MLKVTHNQRQVATIRIQTDLMKAFYKEKSLAFVVKF